MKEERTIALESEAGFRALFEYATVGIVVASAGGKIELANPHAEELFGYSNAELVGQPLEVLIPTNLRKRHEGHREKYFDRPKARPMGYGMDLYARKKSGEVFPVEISLGHYQLEGEMLAVAFVTDISARKKAEAELKQVNEELEQRVTERTLELTEALEREKELNDMKSRFVSMASHEFRTPLSAIMSSLSLLERYSAPEQADKREKHFVRIKSAVNNLISILDDFLSLDKLERGKTETEIETFEADRFARSAIESVDGLLKSGQHITYVHSGEKTVNSDKKILQNILLNLLSNAIKYSDEGKTIYLNTDILDDKLFITIRDEGMGIPEEDQKDLFRMFHRARNSVNIQGTGLGLNIVKRYVELLHGNITFSSKLEEGTTFRIELPRRQK
jgi:PAS domain S-box-containing protein